MPIPHCHAYCSFVLNFIIGKYELFFYFKIVLAILDLLNFHMNFKINLLVSTKKPTRVLKGLHESVDLLMEYCHPNNIKSLGQQTWHVFTSI